MVNKNPRGLRVNMPSGYVIGRASKGSGRAELVRIAGLGTGGGAASTSAGGLSDALTSSHIFVGNASNVATDVAVSGDATMANTGALTIANNAVTNAKFADMAAYTIKVRNAGTSGDPSDAAYSAITTKASPASGDFVLGWDSTGVLKKYDIATLPAGAASPTGTSLNAEILADSPTAYWRCNDTSGTTIVDSVGGFNLTVVGTPTLAHSYLVPTDTTSKYLRIKGTTDGAEATTGLGLTYPLTSDVSFECIALLESSAGNFPRVFGIGLNTSETQANNEQFNFYFNTGSSLCCPHVFWESGAGSDTDVAISPTYLQVILIPVHFAVTIDRTAKTVEFYMGGRQVGAAQTYVTNPDGGTGSIKATIGYDGNNTNNFVVGEIALYYNKKMTAARWWAHARAAGLAAN